ncbi:hypothetical protein ACFYNZ_15240 [Streptomyces kebangsaanensis]|uniref:Uncharacterized protein n=1 Tax=Streptomyces kebangsaanensis TaxID=864058 RepID=A0ABW6KSI9_9ACTN
MKQILFGATLAVLWLLFGLPTALPSEALTFACQPVILAFGLGLAVRPHLPRVGRWTR